MEYLARNGYRVIPLAQLARFLDGKEPLPRKSVVITIDDGYRSTYEIAYPILKKYGFPATVFLYSDFVGAADAMTWAQMKEMVALGPDRDPAAFEDACQPDAAAAGRNRRASTASGCGARSTRRSRRSRSACRCRASALRIRTAT